MTDIHSHLIYGIDDGARSLEESIELIKKLSSIGFDNLIITPHYIEDSEYSAPNEIKEEKLEIIRDELKKNNIDVIKYITSIPTAITNIFFDFSISPKLFQVHAINNIYIAMIITTIKVICSILPFCYFLANFLSISYFVILIAVGLPCGHVNGFGNSNN